MKRNLTRTGHSRRRGWLPSLIFSTVVLSVAILLVPLEESRAYTHYLAEARTLYPVLMGTRLDGCNLCHYTDEINWPNRNLYSYDYETHGYNFAAIESLDSDGDGYTNLEEINALSFPGDRNDVPASGAPPTAWIFLPLVFKGSASTSNGDGQYVIIGWNDLGMHCMDPSYEDFSVLPPFNTLWAQVIRRGEEPRIVTNDVSVEYRIIDNTYSVVKTNFWDYAHQLFNLPKPLLPNIGLTGMGLSGDMHTSGDHFVAEGIPLTEFRDSDLNTPYPYQVAELVAKGANGQMLATTQTVAPISTEMNCQNCHDDNGIANPGIATGKLKQNILTLHDQEEGTTLMLNRPVLCASCHSSNALGTPGEPGLPNLSQAVHDKHKSIDDGTMEGTCYLCHPGPQTRCLRGIMFQEGETCQNCHGNMSDVANPAREPWLDEPRCQSCHGARYGEDPGKLYRFSTGHGGVYCQACHGSQHAIYPTVQENDNLQSILLQNHAGTIDTCMVCHTRVPDENEGPHQDDGD